MHLSHRGCSQASDRGRPRTAAGETGPGGARRPGCPALPDAAQNRGAHVCPDPSQTYLSRMTRMLSEVIGYYGFTRDVRHVGYFETAQHQQIVAALKTAIKQGQLVALSGIVGCGKTTTLHRLQEGLGREPDLIVSRSLAVDKDRVHLGTLIFALFYAPATEKDITIPTQPEKRERQLLDLIHKRRKTVALVVDEAHDLHSRTLLGVKRIMELVRASGKTLAVI